MKIATWNLGHAVTTSSARRAAAWSYLANRVKPDIALVQEAGDPLPQTAGFAGKSMGRWWTATVGFGMPIVSFDRQVFPRYWRGASRLGFDLLADGRPGTLAIGETPLPDGAPLLAISLYGQLRYADQTVLRAAASLLPLFDSAEGHAVVLGGDFNLHTHSDDPAERRRAKPILELFESFGLQNLLREAKARGELVEGQQALRQPCPCDGSDCYHVRTHRHRTHKDGQMASNDYLFATPFLASRMTRLTVMNGDADGAWEHSDHCPLVVEFEV